MSNIDEQFVDFVVKSLVSNPDKVEIKRSIDEKGVLLELTVDPEDLGRVIGKRGATAQSIRTLLRALGTKNDARYNLKIVDNGEPQNRRPRDDDVQRNDDSAKPTPVADDTPSQAPVEDTTVSDDTSSADDDDQEESLADRTRKELDDLDDLDI